MARTPFLRPLLVVASLASASASLSVSLSGCGNAFSAAVAADSGAVDAFDENPGIVGPDVSPGGMDSSVSDAPVESSATDGNLTDGASDANDESEPADGGEPVDASEGGSSCTPPNLVCDAACVPSDVHNCGACGHDCTDLLHVSGPVTCTSTGACSFSASSCAPGWAACGTNPDTGCETDLSQPAHCGACATTCTTSNPVCSGSGGSYACATGCAAPTGTLCSGTCVDTTSNPSDCNGCGMSCSGVAHGQPACSSSACTFTCDNGYSACPTASPTECVDEQGDPNDCGGCSNTCPAPTSGGGQATCTAGHCGLTCNPSLTACPVASPTECDDTTTDVNDCGGCGHVCMAVPNSTAACVGSGCTFNCDGGYQACDGACIPNADTVNGAFVSPLGGGTTCSATSPCSSIQTAILTGKTILYLDRGTYTGVISLPSASLAIHGGWTYSAGSGTWTNCGGLPTTSVIAAQQQAGPLAAVFAEISGSWTLDSLVIDNEVAASAGQSLYGVFASEGTLALTDVGITVAAGGAGAAVGTGSTGTPATGSCPASNGGAGTAGAAGTGGAQGTYAANGFAPGAGSLGNPGLTSGAGGATPASAPCDSLLGCCPAGAHSSSTTCSLSNCGTASGQCGGAASAGCGGGVGGEGPAGNGGGASIGVMTTGGAVTLTSVSITAGNGGTGGNGGAGGAGGGGSVGADGTPVDIPVSCFNKMTGAQYFCTANTMSEFASGTLGGAGGAGGQGGGGAGGDSLCYATALTGTVTGAPSCTPGTAGAGGNAGLPGTGATGRAGSHN